MRHTRLAILIFSVLATVLLSGAAFADSMDFTGPQGNNLGGVYTYPYNFTVNGTSMQLLCDTFDNEITSGETWTATESSIPTGIGLFGPESSADYAAAGLIFDAIVNANGGPLNGTIGNTNDANWAIWALFSTTAYDDILGGSSSPFGSGGDPNALSIYAAALADAPGAPATDFSGIVVYTPVAGTQSGNNGTPQEFLGYTPDPPSMPEPGGLSLLGVLGLFGVTGFAFRKRLAPKLAINFQQ